MGNKYPLSKVNSDISLDIFPRCTFADTAHLMLWKYVHLWFIIQPKMPALQCGGVQMELMLFVRHQILAKSCLFVNCPPPTAFKVSFVLFPNLFATWSMAECGKESISNKTFSITATNSESSSSIWMRKWKLTPLKHGLWFWRQTLLSNLTQHRSCKGFAIFSQSFRFIFEQDWILYL